MYDVRIINNEAILFEDDIEMNLESYRKDGDIRYTFADGSCVAISRYNTIIWYGSNGKLHRDGDMPAHITTNGLMVYCKHGKRHREFGPAIVYSDGSVEYWIDGIPYTKKDYIYKLNSRYGIIYHV